MRLMFIGSSRFGLRCLEKVIHLPKIEVVGIITNPKVFSISYRPTGVCNVLYANFHSLAKQYGIPVWIMQSKMNNPDLLSKIRVWQPDFILVVGWYHLIPRVIRDIAPTAGLHASLLPDYSGGAPLVWAIINDEEKTGISFFMMEDEVDSGPIIGQAEVPIYFEDTISTLYARIEEAGLQLLEKYLPKIARGEAIYISQDNSKRRVVRQRTPEDGEIDWAWSARRIYNFIRAQTRPYPGAFTYWRQEKVTIWTASLSDILDDHNHPVGAIVNDSSSFSEAFGVWCGDGRLLRAHEIELSEGMIMSGTEFVVEHNLPTGTVLGSAEKTG